MRNAALNYLERGWSVIPIQKRGKAPAVKWEEYCKEGANAEKIEAWWVQDPDYNVGTVTGRVSGIVVIDVDSEDGVQALKEKFKDNPEALRTLTSETGRAVGRGMHLFFKHPMGDRIPNAVHLFKDVDVRADGGIIVLPPSIHKSGARYKWIREVEMLPFPKELLDMISKDKSSGLSEQDWEKTIERGARDDELTRRTGKLFRAGLPAAEILSMMQAWNVKHCDPPLPQSQVRKIVGSIEKRHNSDTKSGKSGGSEPKSRFRVLGFEDAANEFGLGEEKWAIQNWLPQSTVGMLVAPPGAYKTWLMLCLAVSVATGRRFLRQYHVAEEAVGPVLIVQQEDPFPTLFNRISKVMGVGKIERSGKEFRMPRTPDIPPIYWHPDQSLQLADPEVMEEFCGVLRTIKPKLVLIDPLYSIASAEDFMASGAQDLLQLKALRNEIGCSFLIAHHTQKSGGDGRERLWGSQFLNAWIETGWQIKQIDKSIVSLDRHFKHHQVPPTVALDFDITEWGVNVDVRSEVDVLAENVKEMLSKGDVKSQRQAAEGLGVSVKETTDLFNRLGVRKKGGAYKLGD
jgi:hypothetical protein